MEKIKIGIIGIGNCASSLIQGIYYYRDKDPCDVIGLMHWNIGGYSPGDIEVVLAFDIDQRKVGLDISEAIFQRPNCTAIFEPHIPHTGTVVQMGKILDGCTDHMKDYPEDTSFRLSDSPEADLNTVVQAIKHAGVEILLNYLPVGSESATKFYAECALQAGVAFINNMPVFIASDPVWAARFEQQGLPIIGDDIKAQVGATILHRMFAELLQKRGAKLDRSYQLNTGGNTDFLNMLDRTRLKLKKISKTDAVQSVAHVPDPEQNLHVGPSDYVPWQRDNKVCFLRIEGRIFGDVPFEIETRLSVEDSPNSAGVVIDAIRCCKLALDRKIGGVLEGPSSYFCKHPPIQRTDSQAYDAVQKFIQNTNV